MIENLRGAILETLQCGGPSQFERVAAPGRRGCEVIVPGFAAFSMYVHEMWIGSVLGFERVRVC